MTSGTTPDTGGTTRPPPTGGYTKLMVIGGGGSATFKVEVIDLSGQGQTCNAVADFPIDFGSFGTYVESAGKILVCGGSNNFAGTTDCYTLSGGVSLSQFKLYMFAVTLLCHRVG